MDALQFEQECQTIASLHDLLAQEQLCLMNAEIDKLQGLIDEKSKLIQSLNQLARKRYDWLVKAGFNGNELGMNQWVNNQRQQKIQAAWLSTQQTLVKAKEINRVNGMLISRQAQRTQQRLQALHGQPSPHAHVYGPNGQAAPQVAFRNASVMG